MNDLPWGLTTALNDTQVKITPPLIAVVLPCEEMPQVIEEFTAWTKKAIGHVPRRLKDRMKFARQWCYKPRHIGLMVDIIADSYRYQMEKRQ